ncbi:hypothetical protein J1N35_032025 [Gossypium stocksii]|uniref:Uncharacterized protein n=1 Tax=Gossypium stocksii TaxID=47602 RepID=A0A9D3V2G5_9ROSI|nr:hypothetical protein J1N35_032025 [Gossypium stocksii]
MDQTTKVTVIALTVLLLRTLDTTDCDDRCCEYCDDSCSKLQENSDCKDAHSRQENVSNDEMDFDMILSQLKRKSNHKSNWKFEGELLAAFGKYLELCMKDVFAVHWQQTSGEKLSKAALCQNQRGFNKIDTCRGCTLEAGAWKGRRI